MKLIMENWNKFINEEEQVEEGIMDTIKGFLKIYDIAFAILFTML